MCSYGTGRTAKINKCERVEQFAGEVPGPRRSSHTLLLYFLVQVLYRALSGRWERKWAGGRGEDRAQPFWGGGGAKNKQQMRGLESNTQDRLRPSRYVALLSTVVSDRAVSRDVLPTFRLTLYQVTLSSNILLKTLNPRFLLGILTRLWKLAWRASWFYGHRDKSQWPVLN